MISSAYVRPLLIDFLRLEVDPDISEKGYRYSCAERDVAEKGKLALKTNELSDLQNLVPQMSITQFNMGRGRSIPS